MTRWWLVVAVASTGCGGGDSDTAPPPVTYEATWDGMRTFMDDSCTSCHAEPSDPSNMPTLPVDLEADVRAGAGELVVAGHPAASRLWQLVSGEEEVFFMPQDGLLPAESVAHVEQWILDGASLGEDTDAP